MKSPRSKKTPALYQLKITLQEVRPAIWRRVLVAADVSLAELHLVLNEAMGWTNSHLHQWEAGERNFGDPESDPDGELEFEDERKVKLSKLVEPGDSLVYEYDFGDGWGHDVLVEACLPLDPRMRYPLCIAGARACPPEDCGGVGGYESMLETIASPEGDDDEGLLAWLGGHFDPEGFDANRTNRALRELNRGFR